MAFSRATMFVLVLALLSPLVLCSSGRSYSNNNNNIHNHLPSLSACEETLRTKLQNFAEDEAARQGEISIASRVVSLLQSEEFDVQEEAQHTDPTHEDKLLSLLLASVHLDENTDDVSPIVTDLSSLPTTLTQRAKQQKREISDVTNTCTRKCTDTIRSQKKVVSRAEKLVEKVSKEVLQHSSREEHVRVVGGVKRTVKVVKVADRSLLFKAMAKRVAAKAQLEHARHELQTSSEMCSRIVSAIKKGSMPAAPSKCKSIVIRNGRFTRGASSWNLNGVSSVKRSGPYMVLQGPMPGARTPGIYQRNVRLQPGAIYEITVHGYRQMRGHVCPWVDNGSGKNLLWGCNEARSLQTTHGSVSGRFRASADKDAVHRVGVLAAHMATGDHYAVREIQVCRVSSL